MEQTIKACLGVDAGNITLFKESFTVRDKDWYAPYVQRFELTKDSLVTISVVGYHGTLTRKFRLDMGNYILGDACYIIPEKDWQKYLDYTNYMKHNKNTFDTGGDGSFNVTIKIEKRK